MSVHGAVLLAAGGSTRLGTAKQLICIDGEPLVRRAARMALASSPLELVVVRGAESAIDAALADLPLRIVDCANWREGMAAALRTGVSSLNPGCAGALVLLCDQPDLDAAHLERLLAAWRARPLAAVATRYAGVRGVPALLPRAWFEAIAQLAGDVGARRLLRSADADVIEVDAPALERDLDGPGDL